MTSDVKLNSLLHLLGVFVSFRIRKLTVTYKSLTISSSEKPAKTLS